MNARHSLKQLMSLVAVAMVIALFVTILLSVIQARIHSNKDKAGMLIEQFDKKLLEHDLRYHQNRVHANTATGTLMWNPDVSNMGVAFSAHETELRTGQKIALLRLFNIQSRSVKVVAIEVSPTSEFYYHHDINAFPIAYAFLDTYSVADGAIAQELQKKRELLLKTKPVIALDDGENGIVRSVIPLTLGQTTEQREHHHE